MESKRQRINRISAPSMTFNRTSMESKLTRRVVERLYRDVF